VGHGDRLEPMNRRWETGRGPSPWQDGPIVPDAPANAEFSVDSGEAFSARRDHGP